MRQLLALGQHDGLSESLARHIRIANAIALVGATLSALSMAFDLLTGPEWFLISDAVALVGFASCWVLNARGHTTASRVTMLIVANLVIVYSTILLGSASKQQLVFFALVIFPFLLFDLAEISWLATTVCLPIVAYFATQAVNLDPFVQYSIEAYRFYSPAVAFGALVAGSLVAARENRRAATAVLDARERAVASARLAALGEMASGIAHEIRNPLTAIKLAAEQIAAPTTGGDTAKLGARVERMTGRISSIVDALSSFARDASADPFVAVPVQQIVADTFELCQRRFAAHAIELTVPEISPSVVVECRPVQVSQILLNLLNNAHDAVEAAPARWVRLEVDADPEHLEIAVVDSGPGIPRDLRTRIFEPFFTSKGPDRGTGLGLSLSRGLAEAHHGTLELDEAAPHTRFVLRLPLRHSRTGVR